MKREIFKIGDIVQTKKVELNSSWTKGTKAKVIQGNHKSSTGWTTRTLIEVEWLPNQISKNGDLLNQSNGAYYADGFTIINKDNYEMY